MALKKSQGEAEIVTTTAASPNLASQNDGSTEDAGSEQANLPAATEFDAAGAPQQIVPDVDVNHPAVDANPRANTTVEQNKIDFNDPTIPGHVAVERALGMTSAEDAKKGE